MAKIFATDPQMASKRPESLPEKPKKCSGIIAPSDFSLV